MQQTSLESNSNEKQEKEKSKTSELNYELKKLLPGGGGATIFNRWGRADRVGLEGVQIWWWSVDGRLFGAAMSGEPLRFGKALHTMKLSPLTIVESHT